MVGRVGRLGRSGTGACPGRDGLESDGDRHGRPDDRPGPASTSLNPRARHLTHEHVPLADVLAGYPTISRVK